MKRIFSLSLFIIISVAINAQNIMTDTQGKKIDVAIVKATFNNTQTENVIKFGTFPNRDLRKTLTSAWGKSYVQDLEDSILTGKDTNVVRTYFLLNTNGNYINKRYELLCRLGYEKDGALSNRMDSLCMGIDLLGFPAVGYAISRDNTKGYVYLLQKDNRTARIVLQQTVMKVSNYSGRNWLYSLFY